MTHFLSTNHEVTASNRWAAAPGPPWTPVTPPARCPPPSSPPALTSTTSTTDKQTPPKLAPNQPTPSFDTLLQLCRPLPPVPSHRYHSSRQHLKPSQKRPKQPPPARCRAPTATATHTPPPSCPACAEVGTHSVRAPGFSLVATVPPCCSTVVMCRCSGALPSVLSAWGALSDHGQGRQSVA